MHTPILVVAPPGSETITVTSGVDRVLALLYLIRYSASSCSVGFAQREDGFSIRSPEVLFEVLLLLPWVFAIWE